MNYIGTLKSLENKSSSEQVDFFEDFLDIRDDRETLDRIIPPLLIRIFQQCSPLPDSLDEITIAEMQDLGAKLKKCFDDTLNNLNNRSHC